jgi:hypothetical protein
MQHGLTFTRRILATLFMVLACGVPAASAGAAAVTLAWDPNTELSVVGYRVFVGPEPGVYTTSIDVGNVTSHVYTVPSEGRVCFAVAAYSAGPILGSKSAEVCTETAGNKPPTLVAPGNQTNGVGTALSLTLIGSDPEGLPVTFSASGLPTGLSAMKATGVISGTPTAIGTFNVIATVSDGVLSTSQAFTWTISASLPGAAAPLRPSGTLTTATPSFEWESVPTATSYRLWVDDASGTDPKIQADYTPAAAGCSTAGAVCHVSPGVTLAPGRGSWSVRASNASGAGPWSGAMDFTVPDGKSPTITITSPTSASTHSATAGTLAMAGTASDDAGVTQVTWTNNLGGSGTASGTTAWSVASIALKAGTNVITVTARDAGGNVGTDVLTVTKSDSEAPVVSITAPTAAATYTTPLESLPLSGTATDAVGVTQVTWVSDRGVGGTAAGTSTWSIAGVALKAGANVITVTALDAAGNKSSDVVTVTLSDAGAPTVAIATPTSAGRVSTKEKTISLGGTAADAVGVTEVRWSNDRGGSGIAAGTRSWSIAAIALQAGVNVIVVTASDAAGNTATDKLTVTSDSTAPALSITLPVTAAALYSVKTESVALSGTASDEVGVTEVRWSNDRGGSGKATGTTAWTISAVPLQPGLNVITVTAQDAAGNRTSQAQTVARDSEGPTITIVQPAASFVTNRPAVTVSGKATDSTGVSLVTWSNSRGGGGTATGTTDWSAGNVPLLAGANVITVTARDGAGNSSIATTTVTLDSRAPSIAIATPSATGSFATIEEHALVGGTAGDDTAIDEIMWSNSLGGSSKATGTTAWTARVPLKIGVNEITFTVKDTAGNRSSAVLKVRVADKTAPVVRILLPAREDSFVTSSSTINLEGVASDDFGVAQVAWASSRGGSGVARGDGRWIAGGIVLQPGVNVIIVTAADASGNTASDELRVTYDRGLPTVTITAPTSAGTHSTGAASVALAGTASDDGGITQVTWATDRGQAGTATGTSSWTIPAVTIARGTTIITVTARDSAGNTSTAALSVSSTDSTAPVVKFYSPTTSISFSTSAATIVIGGTATDDVGVTQVTWSSDRGGSGVAFGTSSWSASGIAVAPGANVITVNARDAQGNTGFAKLTVYGPTTTSSSTSGVSTSSLSVESAPATTPSATAETGSTTPPKRPALPKLSLSYPTADSRWTSGDPSVMLRGTATENVVQVTWSSESGATGVATGTINWAVAGIPLRSGANRITLTARDADGRTDRHVVTITYSPRAGITAGAAKPTS